MAGNVSCHPRVGGDPFLCYGKKNHMDPLFRGDDRAEP